MARPLALGDLGDPGAAGKGLGASRRDDLGSTHTGTSPSGGVEAAGAACRVLVVLPPANLRVGVSAVTQ